ncbi:hypothetical protein DAKH74_027760 [Maudiozyma humilis]|uniref:Zn(2)-C6 fungal-type domain-containing protein n=1 Tax=Maudiozyma humilis TaxID=51915 RepID=A0AAV5RXI2_MAUHU|nr:hypothetical protein DAKH74_027760 [Kazachstania humilis]
MTDDTMHVRKRRRVPKSCSACRRKKLRCDRVRPMCSSCTIRQIGSCEYEEDEVSAATSREGSVGASTVHSGATANVSPVQQNVSADSAAPPTPPATSGDNPCLQFMYVHRDPHTGKTMSQGPTSLKTFVSNIHPAFTEKFDRMWKMTEPERLQWQEDHKEWLTQIEPLRNAGPLTETEVSVQEICTKLPPYNKLHSAVNTFFTASPLYDINTILSSTGTLTEFYMIFNPDVSDAWMMQDRFVKKLTGPINKYHYKLGILLMINRIVMCRDVIDPMIETYLRRLEETVVPGGSYINQIQFLLLRWFHRKVYFTKLDDTKLLHLVGRMVDTALDLGLHMDIEKVYSDYKGNMQLLKNMWLWVQFADLSISFQFGRALRISSAVYRNFAYNNVDQTPFIKKLDRFMAVARSAYDAIYLRASSPDLKTGSQQLRQFISVEFSNLGDYYGSAQDKGSALSETRILMLGLGMLISLYALRFKVLGEKSIEVKNNVAQTTMVSLHLVSCLLKHCYAEDSKNDTLHPEDELAPVPPHLNMAISLSEGVFQRAQMNLMAVIYLKITLFHKEAFRPYDLQPVEWNLNTIEVQKDNVISMKAFYDMYMEIFSQWRDPESRGMFGIFRRSYAFLLMLLVERKGRRLMEKVIELREASEKCIKNCLESRQQAEGTATGASPQKPQPSSESRDADIPPEEQEYPMDETMSTQIYNDFWDSFNSYWDDLLLDEQVPSVDFT